MLFTTLIIFDGGGDIASFPQSHIEVTPDFEW